MYSQITVSHNAWELCFAYHSDGGIETLDGLYAWESKDPNNRLFIVTSEAEAITITNTPKLYKAYI